MSTLTGFTEVPVVDVSGLLGPDPAEHRRVAAELGAAARDVGFFHVSGTGLPAALAEELLRVTQAFFALPPEEKMRTYIGRSTNHRGYVPEGEEVFAGGTRDRKEAFDLSAELPADDPDFLAGRMLGPNQWPDVPGFREAVDAWYAAVLALGRALLRGFALALGEPADALDRYVTKPPSQLRLIHYPYDPDAVDAVGIGAHTDYECFTLLLPPPPGWRCSTATASGSTSRRARARSWSTSVTSSRPGPTAGSSPPPTGCARSARSATAFRCSSTSITTR
jgi:isopenicillin N synthase-like dioxygenase